VIWQLIGGAELGLLVLAGLAIWGLLGLLRSDAVDLRPEQLAELERELAVPLEVLDPTGRAGGGAGIRH
jgi:hypothetical protein